MPPQPFIDPTQIDQSSVAIGKDEVYQVNPHRFEFQQVDGIFFVDDERNMMAGYRDVRDDEFWVRGHIPGRPVLPGVLILESAAQLFSYYVMTHVEHEGFLGFGGVDDVKFRGQVVPGDRLILIGKMMEVRRRRSIGDMQGFVGDNMVFHGKITGMFI
jgi:3-hydroxyacyl-[acyl-carrier-protein] dehydratase